MAYLYGASIQGIQGFIFETNKLKEIVGASNLIEWFCDEVFFNTFLSDDDKILRNAGGNIRILFDDEGRVKEIVKMFPQKIMKEAYGITVSQAVVPYNENDKYLDVMDGLEEKLKHARNKAIIPLDSKFALMKQNSRTGKPLYEILSKGDEKNGYDVASLQKYREEDGARADILLKKLHIEDEKFAKHSIEMEQISNSKNKIAVIHADGNKMGLLLQQMKASLQDKEAQEIQDAYRKISKQIENATIDAVNTAYVQNINIESDNIQFRPILIGGDDVTILCSADDALGFTKTYLEEFEKNTKKYFEETVNNYNLDDFKNGLTACAGIAYCNEKFPFHYAVSLAEVLCGRAKKESNREASCLMFHNIQSSFFTDYESYEENELKTKDGILLSNAPYYVNENGGKPTIQSLIDAFEKFNSDDIPLGKFREYVNLLHNNREYAALYLERIEAVMDKESREELNKHLESINQDLSITNMIVDNKTPINDILQLKAVMGGSK